jgi:hypothetical protein
MNILRVLKKPRAKFIDRLTMKQLVMYLVIFAMIACFVIGFLLGLMV